MINRSYSLDCCRSLLSSQQHYDWGLRAIKTVLGGCRNIMANERKTDENQIIIEVRQTYY